MDEVTAAQAAILTGLSERTIRRRIAAGSIPARKIGPNRFAIRPDDLPLVHPFQALVQRVAALEQQVAAIERREAQATTQATTQATVLASPTENAAPPAPPAPDPVSQPAPTSAGPTPGAAAATDIRQALAQLAYEANRLAHVIPTTAWNQSAAGQLALVADASADANDAVSDAAHAAPTDQAPNPTPAPRRRLAVGKRRGKAAQ